jgi:hypothetical protein
LFVWSTPQTSLCVFLFFQKFNAPREVVVEALQRARKSDEVNEYTVAYNLIYDNDHVYKGSKKKKPLALCEVFLSEICFLLSLSSSCEQKHPTFPFLRHQRRRYR